MFSLDQESNKADAGRAAEPDERGFREYTGTGG